jgi:hypothetical protein
VAIPSNDCFLVQGIVWSLKNLLFGVKPKVCLLVARSCVGGMYACHCVHGCVAFGGRSSQSKCCFDGARNSRLGCVL